MIITIKIRLTQSNPLGTGYRVTSSLDNKYVDYSHHKEARAFARGLKSALHKILPFHKVIIDGYQLKDAV